MSFRRKPESSSFKALRIFWTPVFTGVTADIQFFHTFSVMGGVGQFLSGKDIVVGLGARPVHAGSIGRDTFDYEEFNALPPQKAGGASPCPIHGEITALWFQEKWTGPQTMGTLGHSVELCHRTLLIHPSLNGYPNCHFSLDEYNI